MFLDQEVNKQNFPKNFFPVFAQPDINTRKVERILDSYANPRLRLGFPYLSRILPTPLVFISGYATTENVFYCFNSIGFKFIAEPAISNHRSISN